MEKSKQEVSKVMSLVKMSEKVSSPLKLSLATIIAQWYNRHLLYEWLDICLNENFFSAQVCKSLFLVFSFMKRKKVMQKY